MIDLSLDLESSVLDLQFYSDASASETLGFGCVLMNRHWIGEMWEPGFIKKTKPSIEYLELFAVCAGIITWERKLSNIRMLIHCDNEAVCTMINNQSSNCARCMFLLCLLTLNCLQFNRRVFARHVLGVRNELADAISRGQWVHFKWLAPDTMCVEPDVISDKLWPLSLLWDLN